MIDAIAALAKRFWTVLPREIQDLGITREQFYEREMRALFTGEKMSEQGGDTRIELMFRLEAALKRNEVLEAAQETALGYATRFLEHFVNEHCSPVPDWKPLPDLLGVLTQIDNSTTIARDYKARIEQLEARLDRAVTRGLEQVERIATLEAALRDILGAHDLYETECIASAALAPEQNK
jgi:hypothetical protein